MDTKTKQATAQEGKVMILCAQCKYFLAPFDFPTGICTKGHGYEGPTAQGLPKPNKGQGYRAIF